MAGHKFGVPASILKPHEYASVCNKYINKQKCILKILYLRECKDMSFVVGPTTVAVSDFAEEITASVYITESITKSREEKSRYYILNRDIFVTTISWAPYLLPQDGLGRYKYYSTARNIDQSVTE